MHTLPEINTLIHSIDLASTEVRRRIGEVALCADHSMEARLIDPIQWYTLLHRLYTLLP